MRNSLSKLQNKINFLYNNSTINYAKRSELDVFLARSVPATKALRQLAGAASIGQGVYQKRQTGAKRLDRAISTAGKIANVVHTGTKAARGGAAVAKTISGIKTEGKRLDYDKSKLEAKKAELAETARRTDLWEKSIDQSKGKRPLIKRQLDLKERQLAMKEAENKEGGTVRVKGYIRNGKKVKPFTRKKKSSSVRSKRKSRRSRKR
jgi:hypothetical protein